MYRHIGRLGLLLLVCLVAVAVAGCNAKLDGLESNLPGPGEVDLGAKQPRTAISRGETATAPDAQRGSYQIFSGQPGQGEDGALPAPGVTEDGGKFSINIDGADLQGALMPAPAQESPTS